MNYIGRKIYYDTATGNVIVDTGEKMGFVIPTTLEQDIEAFKALSERNRETFDVLELEYGQYTDDFMHCVGYKVDTETKTIVFSYDEIDETTVSPQKPLSEQVKELKLLIDSQNRTIETQEQAIAELSLFVATK